MRIVVPTYKEIAFNSCYDLLKTNPLIIPTYYSTLFITFQSLLNMEDVMRLQKMIMDFEESMTDDLNRLTLQEMEIRMYNNMDLNSGFQVNGVLVSQMEINNKLNEIKIWLTQKLFEYMKRIRFTTTVDMR